MRSAWNDLQKTIRFGAGWAWEAMELLTEDKPRFRSVLNGLIGDSLRYNTGLHISTNGQGLARMLNDFLRNRRGEFQKIVLKIIKGLSHTSLTPHPEVYDHGRRQSRGEAVRD